LGEFIELFVTFFKMGAVTFGGGYAMLPILRAEVVQRKGWVTEEEIMDYYALSQGLPGIIAVNASVFIGYKKKGVTGAIAAALGVVCPCIIIITIIAACLKNFQDNVYVQHALKGISVCVVALIVEAIIGLWKKGVKDILSFVICIAMLGLSVFTSISPILMVVASALIGIFAKSLNKGGNSK